MPKEQKPMHGVSAVLSQFILPFGFAFAALYSLINPANGKNLTPLDIGPHATLVQFDQEYTTITDKLTGIRVSIPNKIFEGPISKPWGNNWQTPDGRLRVATLVFKGRKLIEVFDQLRNKSGRKISEQFCDGQNVVLKGNDQDGMSFILKLTSKSGEIRGISIAYETHSKNEFLYKIQTVLYSYDPFPGWGILEEDGNSNYQHIISVYRQKVNNILSSDAKLSDDDYSYWPELAFLTRDLSLKTSDEVALHELDNAYGWFGSRKLYTPLWAILPRSTLASLDLCTYKVVSVYAKDTENPDIRRKLIDFIKNNPSDKFLAYAYYAIGDFDSALSRGALYGNACFSSMVHYAIAHRIMTSMIGNTFDYIKAHFATKLPEEQITQLSYSRTFPVGLKVIDNTLRLIQDPSLKGYISSLEQSGRIAQVHLEHVIKNKYSPHADDAAFLLGWLTKNDGKADAALRYSLQALTVGNGDYIPDAIQQIIDVIAHLPPANRDEVLAKIDTILKDSLQEKTCVECGDTNYLVGHIALERGKVEEALAFHSNSVSTDSEYAHQSLRDVVAIVQRASPDRRLSVVQSSDAFMRSPALWYAVARESYREFDYAAAVKLAEKALQLFNITPDRLPATTDPNVIEADLRRMDPAYSLDLNMVELPYLLEASLEMMRYKAFLDGHPKLEDIWKRARYLIMKYSFITDQEQANDKVIHKDFRQALHMIDVTIDHLSDNSSCPSLLEWLYYRKTRITSVYLPEVTREVVQSMESRCSRSKLLSNVLAEEIFAEGIVSRDVPAAEKTFNKLINTYPSGNAVDNAYSWMAIIYRCADMRERAQHMNCEIISQFPATRHAIYALERLSHPEAKDCSLSNFRRF